MNPNIEKAFRDYEALITKENKPSDFYNGIYTRYENPVLTRGHVPPFWKFDLNEETNPLGLERLGVNAVMNSGAIKLDGQYCLVARVEGNDRKSFFGVARSDNPVQGFRFDDYPVVLPDTSPEETNVYDMRLTQHEDGYIYGVFCSESKDKTVSDLSAAFASAGIVRTKDLKTWERLPDLKTKSPSSATASCTRNSSTASTPSTPVRRTASLRPAIRAASASACARTSRTPSSTRRRSSAPAATTRSPNRRTAQALCRSRPRRAGCTSRTASAIRRPVCAMCSMSSSRICRIPRS